ncbi:MAG: hypothetical protein EAZ92_15240 [Candidatus Kapaibacterium sp.]|nr:MAG: hypothetical protein EAZ92_15240 [Candidatus Kapabacteria bacterium]
MKRFSKNVVRFIFAQKLAKNIQHYTNAIRHENGSEVRTAVWNIPATPFVKMPLFHRTAHCTMRSEPEMRNLCVLLPEVWLEERWVWARVFSSEEADGCFIVRVFIDDMFMSKTPKKQKRNMVCKIR